MDAGYSVEQIAKHLRITTRTIRNYTAAGVFTPPPFRGADTRYGPQHLEQLVAIVELRRQGVGLSAIRERFAAEAAAKAEAAAAPAPAAPAAPAPDLPRAEPPAYAAERWDRVVLVPGLELLVRVDGGPIVQRVAAEICAAYAARSVER